MVRCTAPVKGHRTASGAANCPACRHHSRLRFGGYNSSYPSSRDDNGYNIGTGVGSTPRSSSRPRWSSAGSSICRLADPWASGCGSACEIGLASVDDVYSQLGLAQGHAFSAIGQDRLLGGGINPQCREVRRRLKGDLLELLPHAIGIGTAVVGRTAFQDDFAVVHYGRADQPRAHAEDKGGQDLFWSSDRPVVEL